MSASYPRWHHTGLGSLGLGSRGPIQFQDSLRDNYRDSVPNKLIYFRTAQRRVMVNKQPARDRVRAYQPDTR
jgi:hypothetical protein